MNSLEHKLVEQAKLWMPLFEGRSRHISFLTIRKRIVAVGMNSYIQTHPLAKKFGHMGSNIHSELSAITRLPRGVLASDCTMYNIRFAMDGSLKMSKPCKSCQKLIAAFDIRKCRFTNDFGYFERFL